MLNTAKVGLVLSGGGAKGAYQVGVLKALLEFDIPVHVVSGASIGALNAAVIASAPDLGEGVHRLERIWGELAHNKPLQPNLPNYLRLLGAVGLHSGLLFTQLHHLVRLAQQLGIVLNCNITEGDGLLSDAPLRALLDQYINDAELMRGLPLYVSVFRQQSTWLSVTQILMSELNLLDSQPSEFVHIQAVNSAAVRKEFLMASAAIPMVFAPRSIEDNRYVDGGLGGWRKSQGNTPIDPLLQQQCDVVIVTHLTDGSLWSRYNFPNTTVIEVRPQTAIARNTGLGAGVKDLLGFDASQIDSWIKQGYQDAQCCLAQIQQTCEARQQLRASQAALKQSTSKNFETDTLLTNAMARLR